MKYEDERVLLCMGMISHNIMFIDHDDSLLTIESSTYIFFWKG